MNEVKSYTKKEILISKNELDYNRIAQQLEIEREIEKTNIAKKYLKFLDYYKINEEFLVNMLTYPLLPKEIMSEDSTGNFYDEMELKLSGK